MNYIEAIRPPLDASSGVWNPSAAEDLSEVVGQAHEAPFSLNFVESPEAEPAKSADLFDLTEYGFGDIFAF